MVAILLEHPRVDPSSDDNYCLQTAVLQGDADMVKLLLSHSVDPSQNGGVSITAACANGYMGVIDLLLADARFPVHIDDLW